MYNYGASPLHFVLFTSSAVAPCFETGSWVSLCLQLMRIIRAVLEELELVEGGGSRGYCAVLCWVGWDEFGDEFGDE